jgi:hypothetical protein
LEAIRVCWKYCCMEVTKTSGELKCQILPPFFFFPSEELFCSLCKAGDSNWLQQLQLDCIPLTWWESNLLTKGQNSGKRAKQ